MSSVQILMDNYNNACYPGQTITGRIECNFNEETSLRAVRVKFKGRAETQWNEDEYDHFNRDDRLRSYTTVTYNGLEPYFENEYNLLQGGNNVPLSPGRYTYPFSYILPPQLPSSFERIHGNVRYYIKATVECPWKFNYEQEIPFTVVSPLDLNYFPELRNPFKTCMEKTMFSCWCINAGALTFNMSLPATGFVSGQEISIGAHIENMTNVNVQDVKFNIFEESEFIAHYPSMKSDIQRPGTIVAGCIAGGIGAHGEKSWTSCITIPPEYMPNLNPCGIINVRHVLMAVVTVPWPHTNMYVNVPIKIGTMPLSGITTIFPGGPPAEIPFPVPLGPPSEPLLPNVPGGSAPYPLSGSEKYQPAAVPSPPGSTLNSFGEKDPSAPPGDAPGGAPYSQGPAPSAVGEAPTPYPSGAAPYPATDSFALPTYEETQQLNEKSGKPK